MRLAQRLRPGLTLFGVAVLLGSMAAVQADVTEPMVTPFAVAAVFAIVATVLFWIIGAATNGG